MENEKKNAVRENIISHRNARGWTQADLAERIDMKPSTYAAKESKGNFKTSELMLVADALNIDIKEFFVFGNEAEVAMPIQKLHEQPKELLSDSDLLPTAKERAVIQVMRSSKQNKDFFLSLMGVLHKKSVSDDTLNKILEILNED